MRRKSFGSANCPVARSLDAIGDWWTLLIMRDSLNGVRRFSDFERSLGVAKNILAARLKSLVAQGIMELVPASDGSAYQEYVPTPKGEALLPVLVALGQWGGAHLFGPGEPCGVVLDERTRQPLRTLEVRSEAGRRVGFRDIVIATP